MLNVLIVIIIFLVVLFLFLAMSVGVAFVMIWIFPAISFEIAVLIGTVNLCLTFYVFIKIINSLPIDSPFIDDNAIIDKIYDEIELDNVILPRSTRSRRKRR